MIPTWIYRIYRIKRQGFVFQIILFILCIDVNNLNYLRAAKDEKTTEKGET